MKRTKAQWINLLLNKDNTPFKNASPDVQAVLKKFASEVENKGPAAAERLYKPTHFNSDAWSLDTYRIRPGFIDYVMNRVSDQIKKPAPRVRRIPARASYDSTDIPNVWYNAVSGKYVKLVDGKLVESPFTNAEHMLIAARLLKK